MYSLVIFASGRGSNAQAIIDYFKKTGQAKVTLIVSNKADAGVLNIANTEGIPSMVINRQDISSQTFISTLQQYNPHYIILAGFLWKIPQQMVEAFPEKIVNIHPALLPKYGGKGMYGNNVHEAVIAAAEHESGITIHYVDEVYDNGCKILQAHCLVTPSDDATSLADKIHKLEHFFYPRTIEYLLENI